MNRAYLTGEDVAQALMDAGIEIRPKDASMIKFNAVAEDLGRNLREQVRSELDTFADNILWNLRAE